jgi:hypothetical protein
MWASVHVGRLWVEAHVQGDARIHNLIIDGEPDF